MASLFLHLVLAQHHLEEKETGLSPAFLLGAVAPDAVVTRSAKRQSHFVRSAFGYIVGYDLEAFEAIAAPIRRTSAEHKVFYEGYRYHLELDRLWLKHCLRWAFLRGIWGKLRGRERAKVAQYYKDMSDFDAYYNAQVDLEDVEDALETLASSDRSLLSSPLEPSEIDRIASHLREARTRTSPTFTPLYLRKVEIEHFLGAVKGLERE